jgi:hypothetical protein
MFFCYHTDHIENDMSDIGIVACLFISLGTCLPQSQSYLTIDCQSTSFVLVSHQHLGSATNFLSLPPKFAVVLVRSARSDERAGL